MKKLVYCETCDKKLNYYTEQTTITRKVKDLEITLKVPVPKCIECKNEVFSMEEDSVAQDLFFEEYKNQRGLIQIKEITELRAKLKISQRDLSRLLGLGEITITRYELGSIPSKANSMMIESLQSRQNLINFYGENTDIVSKKGQKSIQMYLDKSDPIKYTGNRQYSKDKFNELTAFLVNLFNKNNETVYTTKLNKLLFYTEFNFFRTFNKSITGSKYLKFSYGPVPSKYEFKYDMNPYLESKQLRDSITYKLIEEPSYSQLSKYEMTLAEAVYNRFIDCNGTYISNASHQEDAWSITEKGQPISYELSEGLNITI
ncbi:MAG: DUF4065 domain-containing protein [Tenericutes bacterium]|nr:DUF4065 domain-containing protein [Mycoplasmatota bacterium]